MSVGPALALPPSLSHASSCLGVSGVVGKAAPPEMPGWLGLRTSWRAAGKSRAVAIHSGLHLCFCSIKILTKLLLDLLTGRRERAWRPQDGERRETQRYGEEGKG